MNSFINQLQVLVYAIKLNTYFLLAVIAIVMVFNGINWLCKGWFFRLGILPRTLRGLPGIIVSPFLHGNFTHLLLNAILFFVLANMVLIGGYPLFYRVTLFLILVGGFLTWLLGRRAWHIGASGLNMGYWGFLLVRAYQQPNIMTIAIAFVCLYYFGGILLGLFPREERISWEGHLFGLGAGILFGFLPLL